MKVMKNKKIKVELGGQMYELNAKCLRENTYGENVGQKYLYISHVEAGSLVKQFVKKNYPNVVCKVSSSSFSMGNSLDVYVHDKMGNPIAQDIYDQINNFAHNWEYGKFNGMYDIYEDYESSGVVSDNGNEIQAGVKYVNVNNRAKFGTVESILYEVLTQGRDFSEVVKYYTDSTTKNNPPKAKVILEKMGAVII